MAKRRRRSSSKSCVCGKVKGTNKCRKVKRGGGCRKRPRRRRR